MSMMLWPELDPYQRGRLEVSDDHLLYWEASGNPAGKPAVALHGGPGSGSGPIMRRYFDPSAYRIVLFDQRGCGRSTPHAGDPAVDLTSNTTAHLIADLERLRVHLGIDSWLVFGGSWGSTLALAYAECHPERVTELIIFSVGTTRRHEVEWVTRQVGRLFPEPWSRFRDGVPPAERDGNLAEAYHRLLEDPDPAVREKAASDWCDWEATHVEVRPGVRRDPRFEDPSFRMCFARLVTHYWRHAAWLEDGALLHHIDRLDGIPGVLVHGRLDVSSPLDIPWELWKAWPTSELVIVDEAAHSFAHPDMARALVTATSRFVGSQQP